MSTTVGINQQVLRDAAYDADDDLRTRREFHVKYSQSKENFHEWVIDQLPLTPTQTLLDVGTGPGDFPRLLRSKGHEGRIVAADLSEGMIQTAHTTEPNEAWVIADVQYLPFPDRYFNGVMARHMLYHVPDIDKAVRELARTVKADGWALAVTNSRDNMTVIFEVWDSIEHPAIETAPSIAALFPLEEAASYFEPYFDDVQTIWLEDAILLPSVEPLKAYLYSGRHLRMMPNHTDEDWAQVKAAMSARADEIWVERAVDGILTIPKRSGLVIAMGVKE